MYVDALQNHDGMKFLMTKENEVVYTPDVLCGDSKKLRNYLEKHEIQVRPAGAGLHTANYFEKRTSYKNTEYFQNHLLYLPGGPDQPIENIEMVIKLLQEF